MPDPALTPIEPQAPFRFRCAPGGPCFNHCCHDLNQFLTPYDILRLKTHLGLSAAAFLSRWTTCHTGPATGLPVISLRPGPGGDRPCPFVGAEGCKVYPARPSSCRAYPLVRLLRRCRLTGARRETFALLQEDHCHGFEEGPLCTPREWADSQGLVKYNEFNDLMMGIVALRPPGSAPLDGPRQQALRMALYDLEGWRRHLQTHGVPEALQSSSGLVLPPREDEDLLRLGLRWAVLLLQGASGAGANLHRSVSPGGLP